MEEPEAIARLKQGDIGGLEMLVRRYQTQAVRTAYLIVRDRPLAEDIVQSAFVRVYERIGQYDSRRPFAPWFLRIVVNDAVRAAKTRERQVSLDTAEEGDISLADLLTDPGPDVAQRAEHAEVSDAVWAALARLAPAERAAVVLHYFTGLSEAEISRELNSPLGTIKWRLHQARERLRGWLEPLGWMNSA